MAFAGHLRSVDSIVCGGWTGGGTAAAGVTGIAVEDTLWYVTVVPVYDGGGFAPTFTPNNAKAL